MAIISGMRHFVGSSTDTKPTPRYLDASGATVTAADVPAGSTFYEADTRLTYTFDGTAWKPGVSALDTAAMTATMVVIQEDIRRHSHLILRELRMLRQGMIAASTCAEYGGNPEELDEV